MKKLIYQIIEGSESKFIEFITNRTSEWTEEQYLRNRDPRTTKMKLISDEETEEQESLSREIRLG